MVNPDVEFQLLRKKLEGAGTQAEKITLLEQLVALNPKGIEAKTTRTRFKEELASLKVQQQASKGKGAPNGLYDGIRYDRQIVIVGETNTGKSSLLELLTQSHPKISPQPYTTFKPGIGMYICRDVPIQVIEIPPIYQGEEDSAKYIFIRNADVLCVTATNAETAYSAISQLENYMLIIVGESRRTNTHKQKAKEEIIEKPGFVAAWSILNNLNVPVVNIGNINALENVIYSLLGIQRIYSYRNGQVEGKPMIFSTSESLSVGDFALSLDRRNKGKFSGAKLFSEHAFYDGQRVGLDYKLHDGDKVELV
ncbi:MAG: GTPase [archaeon]